MDAGQESSSEKKTHSRACSCNPQSTHRSWAFLFNPGNAPEKEQGDAGDFDPFANRHH